MKTYGTPILFGVRPHVQPIDLPDGVMQVKVRMRPERPVRAYLRYADRIEGWYLTSPGPENPGISSGPWKLLLCFARNVTPPAAPRRCWLLRALQALRAA